MEDTQDTQDTQDAKGPYKKWSDPQHKMLLRLLVDAINHGFRDANGKFNKLTVETRILPPINKQLGAKKTYSEYRNRMKILKGRYKIMAELLRFSSGFGWDPETKKFTASDEVWDDYLKAHPNKTNMRNESFEDFEDLRMIFGSNTATGLNAVGLGDTVDADSYQVRQNDEINDSNRGQIMDDVDGIPYAEKSVHDVFSSLEKSRLEKLPHRKKPRTDAFNSNKAFDEVNTVTEFGNQIFGMIQRRWEKENEEKEAEDKADNVWNAITEIPDLTNDLRYEAMTLIHSLGMKSGFLHMSIEDRKGWIMQNLRKPSE
ncbi:unnamed protein product [Arabidopsis arenosa]|uniref:Myb/SANT-like domain-containing protein n=1 Tax=Arabidopsis arenosa TaxID=38785 RepID=A0A8S1ZPJ1_ARAAE|nr:unnamed protein product [Arabidopsis arenosa]